MSQNEELHQVELKLCMVSLMPPECTEYLQKLFGLAYVHLKNEAQIILGTAYLENGVTNARIHAANQGDAHLGQIAVVMGAGCIGLMTLLALKARGVSKVIVVDIVESRLEKAKELGVGEVINGKKEDTVSRIMELTSGSGFDLWIETAGSQVTASQLFQSAKKGATIVVVGYSPSGEMTLPMGMALDKELTIKTVFCYRNIYPMAIDAVAAGKINIKNIVTNYFELDDIQKALDSCLEDKENIIKGIVKG